MHANSGHALRAPSRADAPAITHLIRSANVHVSGEPDFDASDLDADWGLEGFDLERHAFVAAAGDVVTAYASFRARRPRADYDADFFVHPEHADPALARLLLEEIERRVRADAAASQALLHVPTDHTETGRIALLESQGFAPCRWFFRMDLEMASAPAAPAPPPPGIEIRPCRRGVDEPLFHRVLTDAFSDHYRHAALDRDDWVKRHAGYDFYVPDLWMLAWHGGEPVGAACNLLYPDTGWVDELGVRRDWRGRRLGRALLEASFAAFWKHGQPHVRLIVDSGNATGATRLYETAGMRVERKYALYRKEIGADPRAAREAGA